ncbi:MAG: DUF3800 domain-containing protein [Candidatus Blackburnbacteria bacterium]|nr:DUF3800 domain-containing protein [Candidatus Blackburnbacteria bacterium]
MTIIKTFTFIDESGALNPIQDGKSYFGIGAFKHTKPVELLGRVHSVHEGLCSELKKDETRVEFSFKSTTSKSIKYDIAFLDKLDGDYDWEFNCLYFDCNSANFIKPNNHVQRWEKYVSYVKMLIEKNLWSTEETIVIADYQRKPKDSRKKIEFVEQDIAKVYNILQTESHGVLPVQIADMLLGGYLYSLNPDLGDKEGNKTKIAQEVLELKRKVGKNKFNCWEVDWSKK